MLTEIENLKYDFHQVDVVGASTVGTGRSRAPVSHPPRGADQDVILSTSPLSAVQRANLMFLMLIRDESRQDPAGAACRFGMCRTVVDRLGGMGPDETLELVFDVGEIALFRPRSDLPVLINRPSPGVAVAAAARLAS